MKKTIMLLLILTAICGAFLFAGCGGDDDDDNDDNNASFFPLEEGNRWKFELKITDNITGAVDSIDTMTQTVWADSAYDGNIYHPVVDLPDTVIDLYRADDDYLWTVKRYTDPLVVTVNFKSVKLNPSIGDTWVTNVPLGITEAIVTGECRDIETVETPAGTFDNSYHIFIKFETSLMPTDSIHTWIVPELGPIKYVTYNNEDGKTKTRSLVEYTIAE